MGLRTDLCIGPLHYCCTVMYCKVAFNKARNVCRVIIQGKNNNNIRIVKIFSGITVATLWGFV